MNNDEIDRGVSFFKLDSLRYQVAINEDFAN